MTESSSISWLQIQRADRLVKGLQYMNM